MEKIVRGEIVMHGFLSTSRYFIYQRRWIIVCENTNLSPLHKNGRKATARWPAPENHFLTADPVRSTINFPMLYMV
jgi:hypothetical protein